AKALADLSKRPESDAVKKAYNLCTVEFGRDYVIPKPFDERVKAAVSSVVANIGSITIAVRFFASLGSF
ncbi:hypothetical protein DDV89_05910, partial [Campylobacter jejuni]